MPKRLLNAERHAPGSGIRCATYDVCDDLAQAKAEIARLKRELDQARDELECLTEATSDFVRLML